MTTTKSTELAWLAYCRAGFERDLAQELQQRLGGEVLDAVDLSGFVRLSCEAKAASFRMSVTDSTFARQLLLTHDAPIGLTSNDRVNPIYEALIAFLAARDIVQVVDCRVEYPDTNEGKALSRAAKAIEPRLRELLAEAGYLAGHAKYRAMVFLTPNRQARVGIADLHLSASDPLGIPRFRMPTDAPSRSTLKLAEAIHVFLGSGHDDALQPDMRAVDLGAAPGGWTWQLMQRGVRVTAVDNADLKGDLVDNAMVKHLREDGFRFVPKVPVDWLVCDMVEQPARIAKLVAKWLTNGWARYAIFNLKLPMKKRNEEVERCRQIIAEALEEAGKPLVLQIRQLYHDREEVTGFACVPSRKERFAHNVASRDTRRTVSAKATPPKVKSPAPPPTPMVPTSRAGLKLTSTLPRAAASPWSVKPLPKRKKSK